MELAGGAGVSRHTKCLAMNTAYKPRLVAGLACVLLAAGSSVSARQDDALGRAIAVRLGQLGSSEASERQVGFYSLLNMSSVGALNGRVWLLPEVLADLFTRAPKHEQQIRVSLISTLEAETRRRSGPAVSEAFNEDLGDLLAAVAALKDPRALNILLAHLGTGNIVTRGLAALGEPAVGALVQRAGDPRFVIRNSVARTLAQMLELGPNAPLSRLSKLTIKDALMAASTDESHFVRSSAVEGLGRLPDADARARLADIAANDSHRVVDVGRESYPVREAARKALTAMAQ